MDEKQSKDATEAQKQPQNGVQDAPKDPGTAPVASQPNEVSPTAPSTSEGVSVTPESTPSVHAYHDVADGVQARQSTEAEREARNSMAAAQDKLDNARNGQ